jgi:hypothetical protein
VKRLANGGFCVIRKQESRIYWGILSIALMTSVFTLGQSPAASPTQPAEAPNATVYQPKFPGDPAKSESEAQALAYMRVALRAEREFKKRHNKYTDSLKDLAGTGSFTKRMAATTSRGDYTASFRPHTGGFVLTMTPTQLDAEHRSFYAEEDGAIHADEQKAADASSPKIK